VAGLLCGLIAFLSAPNARATFGQVVASWTFPATAFVISPTDPHTMYAPIPSLNSIAIINTDTLTYETVAVGSGPTNLAFSPDGLKAFIANSSSSFIAVFDTQTRMVIDSFLIPEQPQDVVFANQNRLFVLTEDYIYQIDATTGASTGPSIGKPTVFIYSGSLEISPDRNTLYYGQYGLEPSTLYKIDISGITPALLLETETGENGEDLTLSPDGNSICAPNGAPYEIAKYRTSDLANLGSFVTGPYPVALAFSPDNLVAFASVDTAGGIQVFDAITFVSTGMITGPNTASKLATDSSGSYLFAGYSAFFSDFMGTKVYDVRRGTPTPTPTATPSPTPSGTPSNTPTPTPSPTPPFGQVVASWTFPASAFVISPTEPHTMYATVPSLNSVAIINTDTLTYETVGVGSGPTNLAFSPDGLKAFIANSSSSFIAVFDTQTRMVINSFLIPEQPEDVVFANQNRLFILTSDHIYQIDATTGASTGPSISEFYIYSGSLEISPNRNTLYYGQYGLSPTTLFKFDISGVTPTLLQQVETGSNGEDLTLSHDGNSICHPNGAPYQIAKYRTSDFANLGSFNTGAYPVALAFSPDDSVAYASVYSEGGIKAFDANTFLQIGMITGPELASKLAVDSSGSYLFAGYTSFVSDFLGTKVYNVRRTAPTPTPSGTPSPTPTATATSTGTPSPTPTPTPTATPTHTPTATPTATVSGSPTVTPTPSASPAQALNLSTRLHVLTDANIGIGGVIIPGTDPKRVVVRGIGPSLSGVGITNPLADPILELHGPNGFITITNDNWMDAADHQLIVDLGLAPTNNLESAILVTLNPGQYTAQLRGNNNGTGVGVVEFYDVGQGVASKLGNISTRGFVSTGSDIMIAGFILGGGGGGTDNIIVRAIGPSLTQFGIPNAMGNPQLELRDSTGTLLIQNDDWQDDQGQAELISATGLAPTDPHEAAIYQTLGPGTYTALLSGVGGGTGVGLVEVYDLTANGSALSCAAH
jgi:DNA-binding beta-propeller fold protein YncE